MNSKGARLTVSRQRVGAAKSSAHTVKGLGFGVQGGLRGFRFRNLGLGFRLGVTF